MNAATGTTLGILAGGRATRLGGRDKAWLERDGTPLVLALARRFAPGTDAVLASANSASTLYVAHGLQAIPDRVAGIGPLGGLDALAAACTTPWLLTVPVDMIAVDDRLLRDLRAAGEAGAWAEDDDGPQPLVALWRVAALREALVPALASGDHAVHALQSRMGMTRVRFAGARFGNLNTPDDLAAAGVAAATLHDTTGSRRMPQAFPFPTRIAFDEALAIVERVADAHRVPAERVALRRAHGAILARDVVAQVAQPPFDNAAMDGFALRHADLRGEGTMLRMAGEQFAGRALGLAVGAGECVRITTGAPLPAGADTVVMKENTRVDDGRIAILVAPSCGQHVRREGEDTQVGDMVLAAGMPLTPSRLALAASQGLAELEVARRPTVAVFTTGDELVEPGMPLEPGQLYNSNREQLMGLLRADGLDPVAWPTLPDDPAQIESALVHAGHAFDVVLTCGAVSAGEKDHLPALLQSQGEVHFWKVRMRPGMPVLFAGGGTLGDALFLCLPGNPVSVLATYLALARPLLDRMQGRATPRPHWRARLASSWSKAHDRLEFLRGRLRQAEDGRLEVEPNPADGSHRMRAAADSDALIVLAEGARDYPAGTPVDVLPYAERG